MEYYVKDYIEYDEFGTKSVGCMRCNEPIANRTYIEVQSRIDINKKEKVLALKRLGNWKQVRVSLSDGSYAEFLFCMDCSKIKLDRKGLKNQLIRGWLISMRAEKKPQKDIDKLMKKYRNLKVMERE